MIHLSSTNTTSDRTEFLEFDKFYPVVREPLVVFNDDFQGWAVLMLLKGSIRVYETGRLLVDHCHTFIWDIKKFNNDFFLKFSSLDITQCFIEKNY